MLICKELNNKEIMREKEGKGRRVLEGSGKGCGKREENMGKRDGVMKGSEIGELWENGRMR